MVGAFVSGWVVALGNDAGDFAGEVSATKWHHEVMRDFFGGFAIEGERDSFAAGFDDEHNGIVFRCQIADGEFAFNVGVA